MAGVTHDIKTYEYGTKPGLVAYGVGATQQLYTGCVALVSDGNNGTAGYLRNAYAPHASDLVAGIVGEPAGGTYVKTGPGILGGSTDGAVQVDVKTGTFLIQSGTGSNALSATTNGKTVYYGGENANGPIANATNSPSPVVLGTQLPQDPGLANGFLPGSNYWPIKLNVIGGPVE